MSGLPVLEVCCEEDWESENISILKMMGGVKGRYGSS